MGRFDGLYAASISVFDESGRIDYTALKKLIEHYIENRFDGAFMCSSAGEYFSMTPEKRAAITRAAVDVAENKLTVLTGISEDYIEGVYRNIDAMVKTGAQGFMLMPPRFQVYSQEELVTFFSLAADYSPKPVLIYNHMIRLNNKLTVDTVETLSRHNNILGIKDTHNDHTRLVETMERMGAREDFTVFTGGDSLAGLACLMGGSLLNAISPVAPDLFHAMMAAGRRGDGKEVMRLQMKVNRLMRIFDVVRASPNASVASFSQGIKVAMSRYIPCTFALSQLGVEVKREDVLCIQKMVDEALE